MVRLAITLDGLALQLSKVVMTATMEIAASYQTPEDCLPSLTQLAKDVTAALALHLADLVANWLSGTLDQHAVLLFNENTAAMLQASYWVRPIYEELLHSSSHSYQGNEVEAKRASNGRYGWLRDCVTLHGGNAAAYRAEHVLTPVPNVRCSIRLPGQSMGVEHLLPHFPTVLHGIVQGVFCQQAGGFFWLGAAWIESRAERPSVSEVR